MHARSRTQPPSKPSTAIAPLQGSRSRRVGPPRPTLLQHLEREIAAQGAGFSLGLWLAGLCDEELQQIETAAHRHRGNIFSFISDPLKVALIASRIQDAEGIVRVGDDNMPTQALFAQSIVLETLVQAERMARQGLLAIQGELSMRQDAQPTIVATQEGRALGVTVPDLAAAHAWRWPSLLHQIKAVDTAEADSRPVCPACGQPVPA